MKIEINNRRGYYEVTINGQFYCSADTMREANEEILLLKLANKEVK